MGTMNENAKPGPIEVARTQPSVAELEARIAYLRGVNDQLCEACKAIMQTSDSGRGVFFARKMAADALARARGGVADVNGGA